MKHIVSFLRSPLGYTLNLLATLTVHIAALPGMAWVDRVFERTLLGACEALCLRDGVQDDVLFALWGSERVKEEPTPLNEYEF